MSIASRNCALRLGVVLALVACSEPDTDDGEAGGSEEAEAWDVPRGCPPPEGVATRPTSAEEVVALVNALPKPTSLTCYLEALERPLAASATTSGFSAQPADGAASPRLFLFEDSFVQSIVPSGQGAHLLEMSTFVTERRSVKSEIAFPVEAELAAADPYDRIFRTSGTSCAVCHVDEVPSTTITGVNAYESDALQPKPDENVSISLVRQYARDCDPAADPGRCEMLAALFAHGEVDGTSFPETTKICIGF